MKQNDLRITKTEVLSILVLGLMLISLRFLPFFWGQTLFYGDNYSLLVPGKIFSAQWLRQGIVPLWNPFILSGISWVGDISQSLFYPTTLLFVLFEAADALNLSVIFSLWWTWVGMYLLARRLGSDTWGSFAAAILWTFSTVVTGSINNLATLQSIVFFPWIAWAPLSSKWVSTGILVSSGLITGQVIAGYPQHVVLSVFFSIFLSVVVLRPKLSIQRISGLWLFTLLLTLGLSAFVWLPFTETLLASTRMSQSVEQAQLGSLNPAMMIKLALPYFFDMPAWGVRWGAAWSGQPNVFMYFGIVGFVGLLTLIARKQWQTRIDRFLWVSVLVTFVLAFGNNLPGYGLIQALVPILRVSRYPSLTLILTTLCIILLLARSSNEWFRLLKKPFWKRIGFTLVLSSIGVLVVWTVMPESAWNLLDQLLAGRLGASAFHTLERDVLILRMIAVNVLINGVLFLLLLWCFYKKRLAAALVVLFADMVANTQGMLMYTNASVYSRAEISQSEVAQMIQSFISPNYRMLTRNFNQPYTDFGMYWEAQVIQKPFSDSFITLAEKQDREVLRRLRNGGTPDWNMVMGWPMVHGYTTLLPYDYASRFEINEETRINFLPTLNLDNSLLDEWAVNYYIVDEWFEIKESLDGLEPVAEADEIRIYERPNALPRVRWLEGEGELALAAENPNEVVLQVEARRPGTLIMADRYESGWRAYTNNQTLELKDFEGMRVMNVPEGLYTVQLRYEPWLFHFGLLVSGASLLVGFMGALQYCHARKNRNSRS